MREDYEVIPICVKTLGGCGSNGLKLITEIGKKIHEETARGSNIHLIYLMQSSSVTVQYSTRGNAASVFGTVGNSGSLEENCYL